MLIEYFKQGSEEWHLARLGIPTASQFSKVIAPSGKPSSQQDEFLDELVAQWRSQKVDEGFKSKAMQDGNDREPEARRRFAFDFNVPVKEVGIVYRDENKLVSCSPDGLYTANDVLSDLNMWTGGLEIKNPIEKTFIGYIRKNSIPDIYKPQIYGSMWVSGLDKWTFMANHPGYRPLYIEAPADPAFMKAFDVIMNSFINRLLERRELVKTYLE